MLTLIEIAALLLSVLSISLVVAMFVYGRRRLRRIEATGNGREGGAGGGGQATTRLFDMDVEEGMESDWKGVDEFGRFATPGRARRTRGESMRLEEIVAGTPVIR